MDSILRSTWSRWYPSLRVSGRRDGIGNVALGRQARGVVTDVCVHWGERDRGGGHKRPQKQREYKAKYPDALSVLSLPSFFLPSPLPFRSVSLPKTQTEQSPPHRVQALIL